MCLSRPISASSAVEQRRLWDENKAGGVVVATVTADYDSGASGLRYFMTDSTFEIDAVTGQVKVRSGAVLDYESKSSHLVTVTVTAKDQNGADLSSTQVLTIKVSDVLEAVKGTNGKNVLTGGIGADKINGGAGNDVLTGGGGKDIFVLHGARKGHDVQEPEQEGKLRHHHRFQHGG